VKYGSSHVCGRDLDLPRAWRRNKDRAWRAEEYRERYTPQWHRRVIGNTSATKGDEIALVPGGIVENYGSCFTVERHGARDDRPLRPVGMTLAIEQLAKAVEELLHALCVGMAPARVTASFEIDIRLHMCDFQTTARRHHG
jgi:hypothetical protein